MKLLTNPYLWILLVPATVFLTLALLGVDPDQINLSGRLYFFGLLAYVGARYVGRAPVLMWNRNWTPEGRNVVGFGLFIVAIMLTQVLAWVSIVYNRPVWLMMSYYSPALVILSGVGMTLVASSVPRFPFPPTGSTGLSVLASFAVGLLSALALFTAQFIPMIVKAIVVALTGLVHAL